MNVIFHSETSYCIVVAIYVTSPLYVYLNKRTCMIYVVIFVISSVVSTVAGQGI